ncbi:hypothetical protein CAPTEDRAFT_226395 [Capitella teleta]|uniref:Treslin N-terminal domain-containing protein n=1 Tax=Capitella teleta TaxID=283909 RepID=R7US52_CAPTE|nr:hypothetical protein CAPTEDRAFT_226395 [Capitella teleta]|eukprot:ELU06742.1 hypothetical protein CAPTEDRAFT_226395 [Capitella teleta]
MEFDCSKFRIVFIIDEAAKEILGPDADSSCLVRRCIQSIALRVLTHFAHPSGNDTKRLQWGFRFYDSARYLPKYQIEKRAFCDFDLKSFEELENTIECRFNSDASELGSPTSPSQNDAESNWWQFRSNLRQCLQDILIDYKWESDTFGSPIHPKRFLRSKSTSQITGDGTHNMVFLFAKCPRTTQDCDWFTRNKCDPQLVLKSILPDLGYREFCDVKKIQLHWVDLSDLRMDSAPCPRLDVINQSLRLLSGSIIPATKLLKLNHQLTTFNQNGGQEIRLINGLSSSSCSSLLNGILLQNDSSTETDGVTAGIPLILLRDGEEVPICSVQMSLMRRSSASSSDLPAPPFLLVRALITQSSLELSMFDSSEVKILSTENNSNFCSLLGSLAASRSVLLADIPSASCLLPTTCVLQPLTFDSATLTQLKSCASIALEKSLAFGAVPNKSEIEDISQFVEKCCHVLSDAPKRNQLIQPEDVDQHHFEPEMMDPWYKAESNPKNISHLLEYKGSPEVFDEAEQLFLQKLQDKMTSLPEGVNYHSLESLTLREKRMALSPKTPKKTPRKRRNSFGMKSKKTPVAGKKLRRSPRKNHLKDGTSTSAKALICGGRKSRGLSRTQSVPSRIDLILKRSKETLVRETDDENSRSEILEAVKVRRSPRKKKASICEHANVDELSEKIRDEYLRAIGGELDVMQWSSNIVSSAANFYQMNQEGESSNIVSSVSCQKLFEDNILSTCAAISRKYSQDISSTDVKLNEYQCQVVLRLNLYSLHPDEAPNESLINELASLLRAMTFLKNPSFLCSYLNETLLPRFVENCGRLLYLLFEELLQPLPPSLSHFSPPSSPTTDSSVQPPSFLFNEDSNSQFNDNSVDLASTSRARSSKLKRFASFQSTGSRQIAIAVNAKKNPNDGKKAKNAVKKPRSTAKVTPNKRDSSGSVKRNLFERNSTLSRHHSIAVMQAMKSPKRNKTPKKVKTTDMMSPNALRKTPRRHHVLKTKTVSETPVRKQRSNMVWHHHERKRQRANTVADVLSVQESPDKACATKEVMPKTPKQKKARLLRGASFYTNARSRSVSSYEEARSQGAALKLLSPSFHSSLSRSKQGRRVESQVLFKGFLDPSPDKLFGADFESPAKITELDSPSVNTRLQALKNRMVTQGNARKNLFNSFNAEDTPSKNTRSQVLSPEVTSPFKGGISPKKRVSLCFKSPVKSLSPSGKLDFRAGLPDSLPAITPKKKDLESNSVATPSKNTRSQHRLLSPTSTAMSDLEAVKQRPTKRKGLPDAAEALTHFGSDFKRRKTGKDIHEATDIIVEKSAFLIEDTDANISFPNKENKRNFIGKFGSLESEAQTNSASNHMEFTSEGSTDVVDSPIFSTITDTSDPPPPSPVFTSPIATAKAEVGVSPQIERITPRKTKKYSPLMSKQSLLLLVNSPMVKSKEDEAKSRRELYKGQASP